MVSSAAFRAYDDLLKKSASHVTFQACSHLLAEIAFGSESSMPGRSVADSLGQGAQQATSQGSAVPQEWSMLDV